MANFLLKPMTQITTSVALIAPLANPMPTLALAPTSIVIHAQLDEFSSTTKI
jgi:hypothetical protein